ncbi:MAG: hypothetical protein AB8G05_13655 [Oligoflexales bacterium]
MRAKKSRERVLKDLICFSAPIEELKHLLSQFSWDSESEVDLRSEDLVNLLHRYLNKQISSDDLSEWANLIECREDLRYEDEVKQIIFEAANPDLEGVLSEEKVRGWLVKLGRLIPK